MNHYYSTAMDFLHSFIQEEKPTFWDQFQQACQDAFHFVAPYAVTLYWYVFFVLLATATVGRKLKLRRFYIQILDKLFSIAAVKIKEQTTKEKMKRKRSFIAEYEDDTDDEDYAAENVHTSTDNRNIIRESKLVPESNVYGDGNHWNTNETSSSLESSWEKLSLATDNETQQRIHLKHGIVESKQISTKEKVEFTSMEANKHLSKSNEVDTSNVEVPSDFVEVSATETLTLNTFLPNRSR